MSAVAARLATVRSASPAGADSPDAFLSYDAESFLDEFFPGEATEVEIGAAALVARHRAYTLAQARDRRGLTQGQVAQRMNARPERVSGPRSRRARRDRGPDPRRLRDSTRRHAGDHRRPRPRAHQAEIAAR